MKMAIKLEDPRFCDGCPCIGLFDGDPEWCELGYWTGHNTVKIWHNPDTGESRQYTGILQRVGTLGDSWGLVLLRPLVCIDRQGL